MFGALHICYYELPDSIISSIGDSPVGATVRADEYYINSVCYHSKFVDSIVVDVCDLECIQLTRRIVAPIRRCCRLRRRHRRWLEKHQVQNAYDRREISRQATGQICQSLSQRHFDRPQRAIHLVPGAHSLRRARLRPSRYVTLRPDAGA